MEKLPSHYQLNLDLKYDMKSYHVFSFAFFLGLFENAVIYYVEEAAQLPFVCVCVRERETEREYLYLVK